LPNTHSNQLPHASRLSLDPARIRAVIFDMDGVITDTARLHAAAWKQVFDEFLREHARDHGGTFAEFTMADYRRHVDGKPREDGVRDFLAARGIRLPEGEAGDGPEQCTIVGLGTRKNARFRALLRSEGATAFSDATAFAQRLRRAGIKIAAISSSRNADDVLRAAGVRGLFAVLVDGSVAAERGIRGKPQPDIFLEAARELGVAASAAAIAEDATAGVAAGRGGGFAIVIGIARNGDADALRRAGADHVLTSFDQVSISAQARDRFALPDALTAADALLQPMRGRRLQIFLDYDGTLTPIVSRPEDAALSDAMRRRLQRVAARHFLAVVSGRGLDDLRTCIGLDEVVYAGSHGFEVRYPDGSADEHEEARAALPALEHLASYLGAQLADVKGLQLERKRFGLAVHYRRVAGADVARVESVVEDARGRFGMLRIKAGKKVFEFVPAVDWDKGKALRWILEKIDADTVDVLPIYIGDDVTDEDAFRAIDGVGIAIAVGDGPEQTAAHWRLDDVDAVGAFLDKLTLLDEK
jgi:trehalose 6-phosphate phosphatase